MGLTMYLILGYLILFIIDIFAFKNGKQNKKWILFAIISTIMVIGIIIIAFLWIKQPMEDGETLIFGKGETDRYVYITCFDKVYVPFCAVDNKDRGDYIGYVEDDSKDKIYNYKNYNNDEWIIEYYESGLMDGCMLLKEKSVTEIPEGLTSEYEWNNSLNYNF